MAKIVFYDSTELDRQQLTAALSETDHHWVFEDGKLAAENTHPDAEVIGVFVSSQVPRELIEKMPRLKLIACRSTGFNNVDLTAATERDITVVNVPTYGEYTVAEYAFTLLLALRRKLPQTIDDIPENPRTLTGNDLRGSTIGVIGTGHIGQRSIEIARGFGMTVLAYDLYPNEAAAESLGFSYVELPELLRRADSITLHAPLTEETRHMIGQDELELMKSTAVLINTARGELVDTGALLDALNDKQIAGAGLDVVEGEALMKYEEEVALLRSHQIPEEVLRHGVEIDTLQKMPNVIVTPHNAFNTIEAVGRINSITAQNIIDYWYGHVPNRVAAPAVGRGQLLVTRHAESEWNATGQWTGLTDVHLSEKGFHEAAMLGLALKRMNVRIDKAFCSEQIRTRETLEGMLNTAQYFEVPTEEIAAINERDYGDYTGKNKWEMKEELGEERFQAVRRGWDEPIPNGETLKMVYERAVPFYRETILPLLESGQNILLVAHGNSIRSLMKYIEDIDDDAVSDLEMLFGEIIVYETDSDGRMTSKETTKIETTPPNA
jgi:D-lactate dehydrogenase